MGPPLNRKSSNKNKIELKKQPYRDVHMTLRDHLALRKWGVKGHPNLWSKNSLPWDISWKPIRLDCPLNSSPLSHCQMILLGHTNIPVWLFLQYHFFLFETFWLKCVVDLYLGVLYIAQSTSICLCLDCLWFTQGVTCYRSTKTGQIEKMVLMK